MKISEIKKDARTKLQGKWSTAVGISFVYLLITFIFNFLSSECIEFSIILIILNVPFSFGLFISFIKLIDNENVKIFDFIKYSFDNFGKSWSIYFRKLLKLLLPYILITTVYISIFILAVILIVSVFSNIPIEKTFLSIIGLSITLFPLSLWLYVKSLSYILIFPIAYDNPELSAKDVVTESKKLMKNNRWKFFKLYFSCIGWVFLVTLALIICCLILLYISETVFISVILILLADLAFRLSMLWLLPYMMVSTISFYKDLKNNNNSINEENIEVEILNNN